MPSRFCYRIQYSDNPNESFIEGVFHPGPTGPRGRRPFMTKEQFAELVTIAERMCSEDRLILWGEFMSALPYRRCETCGNIISRTNKSHATQHNKDNDTWMHGEDKEFFEKIRSRRLELQLPPISKSK